MGVRGCGGLPPMGVSGCGVEVCLQCDSFKGTASFSHNVVHNMARAPHYIHSRIYLL